MLWYPPQFSPEEHKMASKGSHSRPVRMRPGGAASGSGNSPWAGQGSKSRLLLHPCSPAFSSRPSGLGNPSSLPAGTSVSGDAQCAVGEGREECGHPRMGGQEAKGMAEGY
ncbi:unnamed protein product [Coccothraustes coccothraustes]